MHAYSTDESRSSIYVGMAVASVVLSRGRSLRLPRTSCGHNGWSRHPHLVLYSSLSMRRLIVGHGDGRSGVLSRSLGSMICQEHTTGH